jgi:predicted 3-demethylubiquinone-9 3-methyltransferase (glyoxalase superfamily)
MHVITTQTTHTTQSFSVSQQQGQAEGFTALVSQTQTTVVETAFFTMHTNMGAMRIDLNSYFLPPAKPCDLHSIPLLLPSKQNIDILAQHAQEQLKKLMAEFGITTPPSEISFDNEGRLKLPEGYSQAATFRKVLEGSRAVRMELSTVHALTSHYVGMQQSVAFSQAYEQAGSQTEIDALLAKYSSLLNGTRRAAYIALSFSSSWQITVLADGLAYTEAASKAQAA